MAGLFSELLGPLMGGAIDFTGAQLSKAARMKAARFCYEVARKASSKATTVQVQNRTVEVVLMPDWDDLTVRQQEAWAEAFIKTLQEKQEKGE